MIARAGDAAADLAAGIVYEDLAPEALNRRAQVAFRARLSGPSVEPGNSDALFLTGTNGRPRLVVREGDLFEARPGDLRTIHGILTPTHGHSRIEQPKTLNDRGQLLLRVFFTDGSFALILASVA